MSDARPSRPRREVASRPHPPNPDDGGPPAAPLTRRALLQGALGAAALGALGGACQPAPASPAAPPPAGAPPAAAAAASAAPERAPYAGIALARRRAFTVGWTSPSGAQAGIWMAFDTGAWHELGLDAELIRIMSSSRQAAAMQAGEVDGGVLDWGVIFQFVAQGGNVRAVSAMVNRQTFSLHAQTGITRPQDVVGKRWGITRLGSSTHTASLLMLEEWRLRPDDVQFIQLQEVPAIFAALVAGQIDVGCLSPPTSTRAVQAGYQALIDLAETGPEYPSTSIAIAERHIAESPDLVRAFVAGYGMGVARFRRDPERALAVLRKYLQLDDVAILEDTHTRFVRYLVYPPLLPMASLPRVRADLAAEDPQLAGLAITDVAVPRFVDALDAEGFFASLL